MPYITGPHWSTCSSVVPQLNIKSGLFLVTKVLLKTTCDVATNWCQDLSAFCWKWFERRKIAQRKCEILSCLIQTTENKFVIMYDFFYNCPSFWKTQFWIPCCLAKGNLPYKNAAITWVSSKQVWPPPSKDFWNFDAQQVHQNFWNALDPLSFPLVT